MTQIGHTLNEFTDLITLLWVFHIGRRFIHITPIGCLSIWVVGEYKRYR